VSFKSKLSGVLAVRVGFTCLFLTLSSATNAADPPACEPVKKCVDLWVAAHDVGVQSSFFSVSGQMVLATGIHKDAVIQARTDIKVRNTPADWAGSPFLLKTGSTIRVKELKALSVPGGTQIWLQIADPTAPVAGPPSLPPAHFQTKVCPQVTPAELDSRMKYWDNPARLPICTFAGGSPFPAKDQENGTPCNDGDSVSLNGLTCAAGDERGCNAVRDSQGKKDGQFWRSPKKRYEVENNLPTSDEKPSSNDSAQGVWAYIAQKHDVDAFRRWTGWMRSHKDLGIWPRYCSDAKCDFNVSDCPMLDRLAVYLGEGNPLCDLHPDIRASSAIAALQDAFDKTVEAIEGLPGAHLVDAQVAPLKNVTNQAINEARKVAEKVDDIREKVETLARVASHTADFIAFVDSYVNKSGAARQDVAYSVYLLKKYGGFTTHDAANAAEVIAKKEGENAFFEYVAHGPTEKMLSQILAKCPCEASDKPHLRLQWIWEREDRETEPGKPQPWEQTMYWDCLFVGNLYKSGPIHGFNLPALPGYADISSQAEQELQSSIDGIMALLKALRDIRQKLSDPAHPPTPAEVIDLLKDAHKSISKTLPGPAAKLDEAITSFLPSAPSPSNPIPKPKVDGCFCHGGFFCPCD
jgi:hypothetical protein